jgi:DNA-binding GntR family transcriptional regulator
MATVNKKVKQTAYSVYRSMPNHSAEFTLFIIIDAKNSTQLTILHMVATSLAPRALYEEVAELLRQRIFSRELEPGSWIDELKIAQDYGISRTPLREALKVLAAEGLVTMKVRRGAYVTEVSERDLVNVYHLLSLLESDAAGVVAQVASEPQMGELEALHQELELAAKPEKVDRERFFEVNERFHMKLLEIADNRWRDQMVADLRKVMKLNRHNSLLKSGRIEESLNEHRALMEALNARDSTLCQTRMQEHFKNGLEAAN